MRVFGQHANLLWEVFESGHLLGHAGEDQSLLRHGSGIASCIKLFMQDVDSCSKLGGLLIELTEVGDLPSQPPVIKVTDVMLQMHKVLRRTALSGLCRLHRPSRSRAPYVLQIILQTFF